MIINRLDQIRLLDKVIIENWKEENFRYLFWLTVFHYASDNWKLEREEILDLSLINRVVVAYDVPMMMMVMMIRVMDFVLL